MTYKRSTHWIGIVALTLTLVNTGLLLMVAPGFEGGYELARHATVPFVLSVVGWLWALAEDTGFGDVARRYFGGEEA